MNEKFAAWLKKNVKDSTDLKVEYLDNILVGLSTKDMQQTLYVLYLTPLPHPRVKSKVHKYLKGGPDLQVSNYLNMSNHLEIPLYLHVNFMHVYGNLIGA